MGALCSSTTRRMERATLSRYDHVMVVSEDHSVDRRRNMVNTPMQKTMNWDWLDQTLRHHDQEPLELESDPLALSVSAHRAAVLSNFTVRYVSLSACRALAEDCERAQHIRRYYRDRFMIKVLRGQPLTEFQQNLLDLLEDRVPGQNRHLGMIYQLPYFYAEDQARDALAMQFASRRPTRSEQRPEIEQRVLRPIRTILRVRKTRSLREFWYADQADMPVVWCVESNNSLMPLMESIWSRGPVTVQARFRTTSHRWDPEFHFFLAEQVSLA